MDSNQEQPKGVTTRRAFLGKSLAAGAGAALGAGLLAEGAPAFARSMSAGLSRGDRDILTFLAALEIVETDLWQQYNELGGIVDTEVPGGTPIQAFIDKLIQLDGDMPQYIHDNTEDEMSHFAFLNAYLMSKGADPVNLDRFRRVSLSSQATGAQQIGRLTNLKRLTIDTRFWTRYRSRSGNPDLGDSFANAVPGLAAGEFPAIPRNDADVTSSDPYHLQAIANTAGFHFAFIEQGGSSLYPSLAQRVTNAEVLRILLSIGPTETSHFQTWHDKAGNAPQGTDGTNGLTFPNLVGNGNEDTQSNLIMPEPTQFLRRNTFPPVSIIRPTETQNAATNAVNGLVDDGLFRDANPGLVPFLRTLAARADAARRGNG